MPNTEQLTMHNAVNQYVRQKKNNYIYFTISRKLNGNSFYKDTVLTIISINLHKLLKSFSSFKFISFSNFKIFGRV